MQKRAKKAGLRLLSLGRPLARLALGWHLGAWISGGSHHSLNDQHCSLGLNCANGVVYVAHLLSFQEPEILACARQRVPA